MPKTLSATFTREPESACRSGAPGDPREIPGQESAERIAPAPRVGVGAARQRGASLHVKSNLGQPAGVLSWERDFLLGLAVNVLEDFVGNSDEEDDKHEQSDRGP